MAEKASVIQEAAQYKGSVTQRVIELSDIEGAQLVWKEDPP